MQCSPSHNDFSSLELLLSCIPSSFSIISVVWRIPGPSFTGFSMVLHSCSFPQLGSKGQLPQGMLPLLFLNNANDPSSYHTKFDIFQVYCWFYKNPESEWFLHRFLLWRSKKCHTQLQTYEKITHFQEFYKISSRARKMSNLVWKLFGSLALFKKILVTMATCLEGVDLLTPPVETIYSEWHRDGVFTQVHDRPRMFTPSAPFTTDVCGCVM